METLNPTPTRPAPDAPYGGARALLSRGVARLDAFDFRRAIDDFNHALALDPTLADARFMRAQALETRDVASALAEYGTLIQAPGARPEVFLRRAQLRGAAGDLIGAMADYQAIDDLLRGMVHGSSMRLRVARDRAALYQNMGYLHGAAAEYEHLAEHDPAERAAHLINMQRNNSRKDWKAGRFENAARGFAALADAAVAAGERANPHDLLWQHLSLARVDPAGAATLLSQRRPPAQAPHALRVSKNGGAPGWEPCGPPCPTARWPEPVFDLFCGRLGPYTFGAMAEHALAVSDAWRAPATLEHVSITELRPPQQHLWRAEVEFHLGQWHLLQGSQAHARRHFEAAAADTRARTFESQAAVTELARLASRDGRLG